MQSKLLFAVVLFVVTISKLQAHDPLPERFPTAVPAAGRAFEVPSDDASSNPSPQSVKPAYADALVNAPAPPRTESADRLQAQLAKLDELQREIDELRRELTGRENPARQILVSLRCIEINQTKQADSGFEHSPIKRAKTVNIATLDQETADDISALLEHKIAKVIAEPTLIVYDGREASFLSGGEIPVPGESGRIDYKPYGTRVKLRALVTSEDRIRIELRMENSQIDPLTEATIDGKKYPAINRHTIDTGVEYTPGETYVLRGVTETRAQKTVQGDRDAEQSSTQIEHLWVIKADFVSDGAATARKEQEQSAR